MENGGWRDRVIYIGQQFAINNYKPNTCCCQKSLYDDYRS